MFFRLSRPSHRAFTVVEIIVAIGVLGIGVYAIYGQFVRTHHFGRERLLKAQAHLLAHQGLEELRASSFDALANWSPPDGYAPVEGHERFRFKSSVASPEDGTIEIAVTVRWDPPDDDSVDPPEGKFTTLKGIRTP